MIELTAAQKQEFRAKLAQLIEARDYNSLFRGAECGLVIDGVFYLYLHNEYYAAQADGLYAPEVVEAVESATGLSIRHVNVLPKDFSGVTADSAIVRVTRTPN